MKTSFLLLLGVLTSLSALACVGASATIKADRLRYPVSLSTGIYDDRLRLLAPGDYQVVDEFSFTIRKWGIFWSVLTFGENEDISRRLNQIVREKEGDAIIDLTFTTINSDLNFLLQYASVAAVGITAYSNLQQNPRFAPIVIAFGSTFLIPGAIDVYVEGKVVRFTSGVSNAPRR